MQFNSSHLIDYDIMKGSVQARSSTLHHFSSRHESSPYFTDVPPGPLSCAFPVLLWPIHFKYKSKSGLTPLCVPARTWNKG